MTNEKEKVNVDNRRFIGYLILDWRDKSMRVVKRKPKKNDIKPFEVVIDVDITLNIPKQPEITAKGEFDIPPVKVREMFLDSV